MPQASRRWILLVQWCLEQYKSKSAISEGCFFCNCFVCYWPWTGKCKVGWFYCCFMTGKKRWWSCYANAGPGFLLQLEVVWEQGLRFSLLVFYSKTGICRMYGVMVAARLLLLGCWLQFMTDNVFVFLSPARPSQVYYVFGHLLDRKCKWGFLFEWMKCAWSVNGLGQEKCKVRAKLLASSFSWGMAKGVCKFEDHHPKKNEMLLLVLWQEKCSF